MMVSKMGMRPTWTVVEHVCRLNDVVRDRDVLIHLTALPAPVAQIFVKVSVVTRDRIRSSIAAIIISPRFEQICFISYLHLSIERCALVLTEVQNYVMLCNEHSSLFR